MEAFGVFPATDKKRKRSSPETADRIQNNSGEGSVGAKEETNRSAAAAPTRPPPSEEEVEEFFTLLRRIHSAVKRTGKSSHGNGKGRSKSPSPLVVGGSSSGNLNGMEVGADNGVNFDLNAVPDEAEEC